MRIKVPRDVITIASTIKEAGFRSYLVGGAVRDQLLGLPAKDYDLCTDALPEDIIKMFRKVIPTGIKHGTVTVLMNKNPYEITTFRIDGKYSDGRRPDQISFTDDLTEDLKRRDFTINSIAYDVLDHSMHDPNNGASDLKKGIIRAIGVPEERFREDGLRSIRACRFASQLNFTIEEETVKGIRTCLFNIKDLSRERIYEELVKIMKTDSPSRSFHLFQDTGILSLILPELSLCAGVSQKGNHDYDVFEHLLMSCDAASPENPIVRFTALFHDLGKPAVKSIDSDGIATFYNHEIESEKIAAEVMDRYRFPKNKANRILHLIRQHMFHYTEDWTDAAVRRFIQRVGLEYLEDQYFLREADIEGMTKGTVPEDYYGLRDLKLRVEKILGEANAFTIRDLAVNGRDIMESTSVKGGPKIGIILNELLETVLDDPSQNNREDLLNIAVSLAEKID
ncbi:MULTISPECIES: CCA tRNA nucleotidyltransferase [unclassified Oceanispirochaeta]|uniref:CCA tRNA nucleotidyltransferase n=1 Tax=unclassified Oceanispirochaeta TaxID=2635722 RepID=UPI000E08DBA0|nr:MULTISPECIES: HD domain-containing protein [unclassified Oceanispirochaeta]MBF9016107.1 HD domain-containing protein [Oceanispirochaeta sp. M2]NPD72570.1 HD domain-containing protein [Oceanispirochaeta sp. M1]RDG32025.1 HD domain-containing protein [Oceanispirochaeta sp. M1]